MATNNNNRISNEVVDRATAPQINDEDVIAEQQQRLAAALHAILRNDEAQIQRMDHEINHFGVQRTDSGFFEPTENIDAHLADLLELDFEEILARVPPPDEGVFGLHPQMDDEEPLFVGRVEIENRKIDDKNVMRCYNLPKNNFVPFLFCLNWYYTGREYDIRYSCPCYRCVKWCSIAVNIRCDEDEGMTVDVINADVQRILYPSLNRLQLRNIRDDVRRMRGERGNEQQFLRLWRYHLSEAAPVVPQMRQEDVEDRKRKNKSIVRSHNVTHGYNLKLNDRGDICTMNGKKVKPLKTDILTKREKQEIIKMSRQLKLEPQMFGDLFGSFKDGMSVPGSFNEFSSSATDFLEDFGSHIPSFIRIGEEFNKGFNSTKESFDRLREEGVNVNVIHTLKNMNFSFLTSCFNSKVMMAILTGALVILLGSKKAIACVAIIALAIGALNYESIMETVCQVDMLLRNVLPSIPVGAMRPQGVSMADFKKVFVLLWQYLCPETEFNVPFLEVFSSMPFTPIGKKTRQLENYLQCAREFLKLIGVAIPRFRKLILLFEPYPHALSILEETDALVQGYRNHTVLIADAATRARVLRTQIEDELRKHAGSTNFVHMGRSLNDACRRCERLIAESILLGADRDVTRVPPAAFLIIGDPGVGKSYVMDQISTAMLLFINKDNPKLARTAIINKSQHIFSKNFADKFWEGYNNQPIVYLDEVGQSRSGPTVSKAEDEYIDLINMVNDKPYPLNMAQLEKKGTVFFDSKLIVGTTNIKHFKIESINEPAAYDRRWRKFECTILDQCSRLAGDGKTKLYCPINTRTYYRSLGLNEPEIDAKIACSDFLRFQERETLVTNRNFRGEPISTKDFIKIILADVQAYHDKVASKQGARDSTYTAWAEELGIDGILPLREEQPQYEEFVWDYWKKFQESLSGCTLKPQSGDVDDQVSYENPGAYLKRSGGLAKFLSFGMVDSFRNLVDSLCSSIGKMIMDYGKYLLIALFSYKIYRWFVGDKSDKKDPGMDPQFQMIDAVDKHNRSILLRNTVRFYSLNKGGQQQLRGFGLGIADRLVCIPRHYLVSWKNKLESDPDFEVYFNKLCNERNERISFKLRSVLSRPVFAEDNEVDMVFVYIDNHSFDRFPDISKNIAVPVGGEHAVFPIVDQEFEDDDWYRSVVVRKLGFPQTYEFLGERFETNGCIMYSYPTQSGDCGLPILSKSRFNPEQRVFGIHIAGNGNIGVGAPITTTAISAALDFYRKQGLMCEVQLAVEDHPIFQDKGFDKLEEKAPLDQCPPEKVVYGKMKAPKPPTQTNIVRSELYGKVGYEAATIPAFLRPFKGKDGLVINPIAKSTDKYSNDNTLDADVVGCIAEYTDYIVNAPTQITEVTCHREVLTYHEAVMGIPGVEGLDGIPRKTSAGYPYCILLDQRGKRSFWGEEGEYDFSSLENEFLEKRVQQIIDNAREGHRMMHCFYDFPKDERRPIAKVYEGKTRKISACPVDLAVCIRMYYGAFIQWYIANRISNGAAVGINVYSKEIDTLVNHLSSVRDGHETRPRVVAGDFGNFDGSLPRSLIEQFTQTVTAYYQDSKSDNERIRWVLMQELANSRHILPNGVVYEWNGSNASGNPLTTILNSWCNNILLRYAMVKVMKPVSPFGFLKSNRDNFKIVTYGDDNLISINQNVLPEIKQSTLTAALKEAGYEYTDESKGVSTSDDRTIDDVSFLKRKFEKNSRDPTYTYLAPLAIETIMESIQWTKKKDESQDVVRDNACKMLCELALHREEVFDHWAPYIIKACQTQLDFVPYPHTYAECQYEMMTAAIKKW